MAFDDAALAMVAAKMHYDFWRPITAIRNAAERRQRRDPADAGLGRRCSPRRTSRNIPAATAPSPPRIGEVMKAEVGPRPACGVRVGAMAVPNSAVQVLPSWDEWVQEVSDSRIYGGVHYRFSNDAGEEIGRQAARMVMEKVMRPLPGKGR